MPEAPSTTSSPSVTARFSFCPALRRPCGGSPSRLNSRRGPPFSQRMSSPSKRSACSQRAAERAVVAEDRQHQPAGRQRDRRPQVQHLRRRPVEVQRQRGEVEEGAGQRPSRRSCRPATSGRRAPSSRTGGSFRYPRPFERSDPCVDVVAALFPVAGRLGRVEADLGQPLDALVAVHLRDHDAQRRAVRAGQRQVVHVGGEQRVAQRELLGREAVDVRVLQRRERHLPQAGASAARGRSASAAARRATSRPAPTSPSRSGSRTPARPRAARAARRTSARPACRPGRRS